MVKNRISTELLEVLSPVVDAGRRALAAMERDEIPAKLVRVAQSTGGRLPPPLARSLLEYIEGDAEFRRRIVGELEDEETGDVAAAFLERPDLWWTAVADALSRRSAAAAEADHRTLRRRLDELTSFAEEAQKRLESEKAAGVERRAQEERRSELLREQLRQLRASGEDHTEASADRFTPLEEENQRLGAELAEARAQMRALRERILRMRRARSGESSPESGSLPADPVDRARALDQQLELLERDRPAVAGVPAPEPIARGAPRLPPGVAPDAPAALTWLLDADAATVIVDGYNVLFRHLDPNVPVPEGRTRLEAALGRLRRRSASRHRVVVVYDSDVAGDRRPVSRSDGVEIRFAPEDALADDEIANLVAEIAGRIVVVSSDREVRERSEAEGALVLWAEALELLIRGA